MPLSDQPRADTVLQTWDAPRLSHVGTSALLFEAPGPLSLPAQQRIWRMGRQLEDQGAVLGAHPGMNNLLVRFDPLQTEVDALQATILDSWNRARPVAIKGQTLVIDVVYGGEQGPDLPALCERARLDARAVARIHSDADYTVFAPGNRGGFGYLFGLDERLFLPRRKSPEVRRGGGHVSIGGMQCSVGAPASPTAQRITGWNLIGQAPELDRPFDIARDPPTLTRPGDRIRFRLAEVIE